MCVIKLYNKAEQLYEISTVNVQTSMNKLLWYSDLLCISNIPTY